MEIRFRQTETRQAPVVSAQEDMRTARSVKIPLLKILLILFVIMIIVFGLYKLMHGNIIYSYGQVAGKMEEIRSPYHAVVTQVNVQRGDVVKQGDVLFVIEPVEENTKLWEVQAELRSKRQALKDLETLLANEAALSNINQPQQNGNLTPDIQQLSRAQQEAVKRRYTIEQAQIEVTKLTEVLNRKRERYEKVQMLRALDAAVTEDVRAIEIEFNLAQRNLEQAQLGLNLAKANASLAESDYKMHEIQLEQRRQTQLAQLKEDIINLQDRDEKLRKSSGQIEFKALFDSIVTNLFVNQGSEVLAGQVLISKTSTKEIWVDAYVAANRADKLKIDGLVSIYPEHVSSSVSGTIAEKGSAEIILPEILQQKLPDIYSAIYLRIDLESHPKLLPGNIVKIVIEPKR